MQLAHVHAKLQFWPAQAKLRGKGSGEGKKKIDMYVDRKMH